MLLRDEREKHERRHSAQNKDGWPVKTSDEKDARNPSQRRYEREAACHCGEDQRSPARWRKFCGTGDHVGRSAAKPEACHEAQCQRSEEQTSELQSLMSIS